MAVRKIKELNTVRYFLQEHFKSLFGVKYSKYLLYLIFRCIIIRIESVF